MQKCVRDVKRKRHGPWGWAYCRAHGTKRRARGEKTILKVGDQNRKPDKEEDALKEKMHLLLFYKKANRITYSEHEHTIVRSHAFLMQKS